MRGIPVSATEEEHSVFQDAHEVIQHGLAGPFDQLDAFIEQLRD
ncbi:hypothetical protein [Paenisporosarcina sp. HGH0030]|nr:hypothetical protein [Paenisporosarcina sp. HGH0030]